MTPGVITLLFTAVFVISACQKDSIVTPSEISPITVGFYAGGQDTRTVMNADGLSASWEDGDKIALWAANSSGNYELAYKIFGMYGHGDNDAFFSATLASAMPDGTYTYYAAYPVPTSVSGTKASFILPAEQDGIVSKGSDIMIATPATHGALTAIKNPEDKSGLRLSINHILHHFRFYVPAGLDVVGEPLHDITFSMPSAVAGTVTADFQDPSASATIANGVNSIRLEMANEVAVSSEGQKNYAIAGVFPHTEAYTASDFMNLTVYTKSYKCYTDPISLEGRAFLPGHSTPVKVLVKSYEKFYRITFKTGIDYIGEPIKAITIKDGSSTLYSYSNAAGTYNNLKVIEEFLGDSGKASYEAICNSIKNGNATLEFETEHCLVNVPLSSANISQDANIAYVDLGDVPYLINEDFSKATQFAHENDYNGSGDSDLVVTGYLLDDNMPVAGWAASRFGLMEGDCVRVNCRYQSGAWFAYRYCGRLRTPALSYIKSGVSATVRLEFDSAWYVPSGYNRDDSGTETAYLTLGTSTDSGDYGGAVLGDISDHCTIVYTEETKHKSEDVSSMAHNTIDVSGVTSGTFLNFWPCTTRSTAAIAANACYFLYIDNVKIYIAN